MNQKHNKYCWDSKFFEKVKHKKRGIHYVLEDTKKRPETQKDHEYMKQL